MHLQIELQKAFKVFKLFFAVMVFSVIKESFLVSKNAMLVILCTVLLDILFLLAFGFTTSFFVDSILDSSILASQKMAALMQTGEVTSVLGLFTHSSVLPLTGYVALLMLLLALVIFVTYVIVGCLPWFVLLRTMTKIRFSSFVKRFALVNVLWFLILYVLFVVNLLVDMVVRLSAVISQERPSSYWSVIMYVLCAGVLYIALPSYATGSVKSAYSYVRTQWRMWLPLFALMLLVLVLAQLVVVRVDSVNVIAGLIVGVLTLPLFSWARIVVLLGVKKVGLLQHS